jgi:hypothetical protein
LTRNGTEDRGVPMGRNVRVGPIRPHRFNRGPMGDLERAAGLGGELRRGETKNHSPLV